MNSTASNVLLRAFTILWTKSWVLEHILGLYWVRIRNYYIKARNQPKMQKIYGNMYEGTQRCIKSKNEKAPRAKNFLSPTFLILFQGRIEQAEHCTAPLEASLRKMLKKNKFNYLPIFYQFNLNFILFT